MPLLLLLAFRAVVAGRGRPASEDGRLFTFAVDPLTMLFVGAIAVLAGMFKRRGGSMSGSEFRCRKRLVDAGLALFLAVFWTMEVLTYLNVWGHPFDPAKSGNDFMWNGYLEWLIGPIVDTTVPTFRSAWMNLLAAVLLLLQLPCLLLGRRLGHRLASPKIADDRSRSGR